MFEITDKARAKVKVFFEQLGENSPVRIITTIGG
jgi:hypothetical protein